jgi:C1A family cysteine protease
LNFSFVVIDEEKQRLQVFREHLKYVLDSNLGKLQTFKLELNEFADWTTDEFNSLKKGLIVSSSLRRDFEDENPDDNDSYRRSLKKLYQRHYHLRRIKRNLHRRQFTNKRFFGNWWANLFGNKTTTTTQPTNTDSFDWRTKNVVSSIKSQLKCGCCYAFATAAVMESIYAIKTNSQNVIDFSPQQISDCSTNGNSGCNGGNFAPSVRYLLKNGGKIATEESYPYAGAQGACKTSGINQITLGNIEYGAIPQGDEKKMAEALVNYGPLFIGLDADSKLFMFYKSGVLNIDSCPNRLRDMDHALTAVGYGYDDALRIPYWIIKNSWGTKWGENGYLRLAKDTGNMCGIASMAYYGKLT